MNKFFILVSFLITTSFLSAQDEKVPEYGWKNQVIADLNFTQNQFTDWAQGGEDSWSWALNINAKFENDQEKFNWANSGKIAFGEASIGGQDPRKAADELKLESVYTHRLGVQINPYVALGIQTQFTKGFAYSDAGKVAVSNFFDPGYFTESFGVGFKPNEVFKTRFGVAFKQTITADFNTYSDDSATEKIEDFKNEIGTESVSDLNFKITEQIHYESKLELFSNLEGNDEIDANWDNTFSAMISEIIKVSLNFRILYDKDIFYKRQIKQTLAIGLSYSFL